ncbi:MAG: hypothetical protein E6943_00910 [Actinomyces sp.]|nr:hypothetical protein [Actinomyces sp.]MDU1521160.1 hypothetical protein [Actinomyces sp.]MDU2984461.1 hypothetical protein [Actinomyces sp.]
MATKTFAQLKSESDNRNLVRKTLQAVCFLAPTSAALPDALTDTSGALQELPKDYWPVGLVTPDGYAFAADTTKEDVDALGYSQPVRSDITKVAKSIEVTVLETLKKNVQGLIRGMDMSSVKAGTNGEVTFDEPGMPTFTEYRMIVISQDGPADSEWLVGRGYPLVKLSEIPEEVWNSSDATQCKLKFDVFPDPKLGTSCRHYIAGTGAVKYKDALGYTQPAA